MTQHHGVMLDESSFSLGDLDLSALVSQLDRWDRYPKTEVAERYERLQDATIVVINKVKLGMDIIHQLPKLKLILLTATGTDNIDLDACRERGISVCNVTNYGTPSVAQHVFSLLLAMSTSLLAYARETASGAWSEASHFSTLSYPVTELKGKTIGLLGYGALARGVETLALAFGMRVIIANRPGGARQPGRVDLDEMLPMIDVLSLHCPLVPETRKIIDARVFKRMKPSAVLINTARGGVVDNVALAQALRDGEIKGAGIDVLEVEPPPADHPLLQSDVPNIIVTPHTAWASIEARQRLMNSVADNLAAWLKGEPVNEVI